MYAKAKRQHHIKAIQPRSDVILALSFRFTRFSIIFKIFFVIPPTQTEKNHRKNSLTSLFQLKINLFEFYY